MNPFIFYNQFIEVRLEKESGIKEIEFLNMVTIEREVNSQMLFGTSIRSLLLRFLIDY